MSGGHLPTLKQFRNGEIRSKYHIECLNEFFLRSELKVDGLNKFFKGLHWSKNDLND